MLQNWARRALALWLPRVFFTLGVTCHPPSCYAALQEQSCKIAALAIARGRELSARGQYLKASKELVRAARFARAAKNRSQEAKALMLVSGCRIRLFDYRGARRAAEEARDLALRANDTTVAGAAIVHLATIYAQVGDSPLASKEAAYAAKLLASGSNKEYLAKALLIYAENMAQQRQSELETGLVRAGGFNGQAEINLIQQDYGRSIEVAHQAGLLRQEARGWEELGESFLLLHRPIDAEQPLRKAFLLEASSHDQGALATNKERQAELQLQKGDYQLALKFIDQAFASESAEFKSTPQFYPLHVRGVLLESLNRKQEALTEYRKAVDSATEWWLGALPGDATSTRTVVTLHDVYHDYAQLAAELSLANHNSSLARQALEALAQNRAADLRAQITLALAQKQRLPQRYLDLLSQLQSAQARVTLGENRQQDKATLQQLRIELSGLENELGLQLTQTSERNQLRNSLRDIQVRLTPNELLLSFCLGRKASFVWAVTEDQMNVYKLPAQGDIETTAKQFSEAVQGRQDAGAPARRLSEQLFGTLRVDLLRKPEWLVVGDGVLLDGLPFSSLPDITEQRQVSLIEFHSLRFLPTELLLLSPDTSKPQKRFVGVGDPIYNLADSRRKATIGPAGGLNPAAVALARLPGSDREIQIAAKQSGMAQSDLLIGQLANVSALKKAISRQPEILHFAVHVVNPNGAGSSTVDQGSQAALALSLTSDNMPELLTPETIDTLRIPGSLVVLDGCSSQKGERLPSAGVMGLSRSWLLAGAVAVVVSSWPTPDDSGQFFSAFYGYLKTEPSGTLAHRSARALEKAQLEMQHSSGYRSSPRFWAAYSIISKE